MSFFHRISLLLLLLLIPVSFLEAKSSSGIQGPIEEIDEDNIEMTFVDHIFSLGATPVFYDFSIIGIAIKASYEKQFLKHLSAAAEYRIGIFNAHHNDLMCYSVSTGVTAYWYPFNLEMRQFYFGSGILYDYLWYVGDGDKIGLQGNFNGFQVALIASTGYKFKFPFKLLVDIFVQYKFVTYSQLDLSETAESYINNGFNFGFAFRKRGKLRNSKSRG